MKTHYKLQGTPNSPVLIFSHSLGADLQMWDDVVPLLLPYFRVLQYDLRGHGRSEGGQEEYSIALFGQDVIDLMDKLGIREAYFCGLSIGGLIGQWLAIHRSNRITKLILSNTAAKIGDEERWNSRIKIISDLGLQAIVDETIERWFTKDYISAQAKTIARTRTTFINTDLQSYIKCCVVVRESDFRDTVSKIMIPTMIITGDQDPVTTIEHAEYLARHINNASLEILPAKHLAATERPFLFAHTLINFLIGQSIKEQGMHIRRTVLGDAHVDKAVGNLNDFNIDFQEFIAKYAWGETWSRPGLSKAQRSMITLAMLIPLNRKAELKMHIKAAFHNGLTISDIKEIILHSALYCGLPAANEANHVAEEVFSELNLDYKN
jgi:3-oxoadipate enol-lactonase / 4-carboxymuconolactone decarboxylase